MRVLIIIALLAACRRPPPASKSQDIIIAGDCGGRCITSTDCDSSSGCRSCGVDGRCGNVLPAEPITDAGVDAPAKH
jgi:hypothetical protein